MAMAEPKDEMSALRQMDDVQRKHTVCAYFQGNRQGLCQRFVRDGPSACYLCGYRLGLDHGYEDGYTEGREDGFDNAVDRMRERAEWETEMD